MLAVALCYGLADNPLVAINRDSRVLDTLSSSRTLTRDEIWDVAVRIIIESTERGLDPLLMLAIVRIESNYNHLATSPVGAEGLMQLMPATAAAVAKRLGIDWPGHSFDPICNVTLGIAYYAKMLKEFDGDHVQALTAYNRGPDNTWAIILKYGKIPGFVVDFYAGKVLRKYEEFNAKNP